MKVRTRLGFFFAPLIITTGSQAAVFNYTGTITDGTEPIVLLMPVGSIYNGVFDISAPGPNLTSDDPGIINSILFTMTGAVSGATTVCFFYNASCGANETHVTVNAINLNLAFNALNEPVGGMIQLIAFTPTTFPVTATIDLTNGVFVIGSEDTGFGEVSGPGSFSTVPVPATFWLLISAVGLLVSATLRGAG